MDAEPVGPWQALVDNLLRIEYGRVPMPKAPFADIVSGLHAVWLELGALEPPPPANPSSITYTREQLEAMRTDFQHMFDPLVSQMLNERAVLFRYLTIAAVWTSHYRLVKRR